MGASEITSKILEDANSKKNEIEQLAKKEADEIIDKAKKEAELKKEKLIEKGEKEAKLVYNRILAEARLKMKKEALNERENLINTALNKLREELVEVPEKDNYKDILIKYIKDGISALNSNEVFVQLTEKDSKLISDSDLWNLEKEIEKDSKIVIIIKRKINNNIIGGAIIESADGTKICDNSLEAVFDRNIDTIRANVASLLF